MADLWNTGSITGLSSISTDQANGLTPTVPLEKDGMVSTFFSRLFSVLRYWWVILVVGGLWAVGYASIMTDPVAVNPTDAPISFSIDNQSYTIPANDLITVPLSHGDHSLTMSGKDIWMFRFGWIDGDSIINPTLSEYVVVEVLYGPESYSNKLSSSTITVGGNPYTGPYTLIPRSAYIKKTWDYGAYEESPASVSTKSDYVIKKELYTIADFKESVYADNEERELEDK
jgi:hypothetical protein